MICGARCDEQACRLGNLTRVASPSRVIDMKIGLLRECYDALLQRYPDLQVVKPYLTEQTLLPRTSICVVECAATEVKSLLETAQTHCPDCVNRIESAIKFPLR
jgi:hypothetical protein